MTLTDSTINLAHVWSKMLDKRNITQMSDMSVVENDSAFPPPEGPSVSLLPDRYNKTNGAQRLGFSCQRYLIRCTFRRPLNAAVVSCCSLMLLAASQLESAS